MRSTGKRPGDDVIYQQRRYELLRNAVALDHTTHGAAVLQRTVSRMIPRCPCAALPSKHAGAGWNQAIDRFAEYGRKRRCLERKARAEPGDLS